MPGEVDGCQEGAGFQRPWLHSGWIRGGVTQLPGDATAVIGCWTWVKRAFIIPILDLGEKGVYRSYTQTVHARLDDLL